MVEEAIPEVEATPVVEESVEEPIAETIVEKVKPSVRILGRIHK